MAEASASPPLSGIRVVDWTHVLAGPYAAYNLALLGADVIRVERADAADIVRAKIQDPALAKLELGETFVMQSSGKRSIAVDARDKRAKRALQRLIGTADVLLENFRPGKLDSLGFAPQALIERHPRLIVCSISGFGQSGPLARRPAYDHVIQAMSGLMTANADAQGTPMRLGLPAIDYATGTQAALAILAALYRRDAATNQTRVRGEWLDVSMLGVAMTLLAPAYAPHAVSGLARKTSRASAFSGNPLSGTFETAEGSIAFVCNTTAQTQTFLECLRDAGATDATLNSLAAHVKAREVDAVHACLAPLLRRRAAADWEVALTRFHIPASTVLSPAEAYDRARDDAAAWPRIRLDRVDGRCVSVPGPGFKSSETLTPSLTPPPSRGQHSRTILSELGFDEHEIAGMFADGAITDISQGTQ